ncbi:MAG: SCO family protein [Natrialbaceae archaeon]|nr:SCO family protein [Natrialbaceae archaeon]
MERRSYLGGAACVGSLGLAGCLGSGLFDAIGSTETVLDPPEQTRGDPSHPVYGDQLPPFSLRDPLRDETVTADQFEGERAVLMTFFFTNCPDGLVRSCSDDSGHVAAAAEDGGYADEVAFIAITFDPARDTASALQEEVDAYEIDLERDSWYFLRPETNEAAYELVANDYGVPISQPGQHEHHNDSAGGNQTAGTNQITHYGIFILANKQGIVERAYFEQVGWAESTITSDLETIVDS